MHTTSALKRIKRDLINFTQEPLEGAYISFNEENFTKVYLMIVGPKDTPYYGGFFCFYINFPEDYPMNPPRVVFLSTDSGTIRFNPNLYQDGKVCLSILGTWPGDPWNPIMSLNSLILSLQAIVLNDNPINNEPSVNLNINNPTAIKYNTFIVYNTLKYAFLGFLKGALNVPEEFINIAKSLCENYVEYFLDVCYTFKIIDITDSISSLMNGNRQLDFLQFIPKLKEITGSIKEVIQDSEKILSEKDCEICYNTEETLKCNSCNFKACKKCISEWLNNKSHGSCPQCRKIKTFDIEYTYKDKSETYDSFPFIFISVPVQKPPITKYENITINGTKYSTKATNKRHRHALLYLAQTIPVINGDTILNKDSNRFVIKNGKIGAKIMKEYVKITNVLVQDIMEFI